MFAGQEHTSMKVRRQSINLFRKATVAFATLACIGLIVQRYQQRRAQYWSEIARNPTQEPRGQVRRLQNGSDEGNSNLLEQTLGREGYLVPGVEDPHHDLVQKKVFSSKVRMVFVVGLEGTGHHFLADVLDKMCKTPEVVCPLGNCHLAKALYPDLSVPETASAYKNARVLLRKEMKNMVHAAASLPDEAFALISFGGCRFEAGMMRCAVIRSTRIMFMLLVRQIDPIE